MTKSRKGFTLVELAVVIVIIGVLAAFGVPQFLKSVERSKAAEAFNYLSAMRSAQERYLAKNGVYWSGTIDGTTGALPATGENLDIVQTVPKYFSGYSAAGAAKTDIVVAASSGGATGSGVPTWNCTLTRILATSSYGPYTVTYDQQGYAASDATADRGGTGEILSNIPSEISPMGN